MDKILITYYANNARKLHNMVDRILLKFGGLSDKDLDDFYSLANEVFVDVMRRYDDTQSFDGFLYSCLLNKIKTEITRRNREKRKADRMSISIDTPIGNDGSLTIGDIISDETSIEKEVFEESDVWYSNRMLQYLKRLSNLQREVLRLTSLGYTPSEIKNELHITEKQYADCLLAIRSYRNISVLF